MLRVHRKFVGLAVGTLPATGGVETTGAGLSLVSDEQWRQFVFEQLLVEEVVSLLHFSVCLASWFCSSCHGEAGKELAILYCTKQILADVLCNTAPDPCGNIRCRNERRLTLAIDPYDELLKRAQNELNQEQLLRLANELAQFAGVKCRSKHSIMELKGLGKEVWSGINANEYVAKERDSWER